MNRKILAAALLTAGATAATISPAAATDYVGGPLIGNTGGGSGDIIDIDDVSLCLAPWQWNGPLNVLGDNAPYTACLDEGAVNNASDAPLLGGLPL